MKTIHFCEKRLIMQVDGFVTSDHLYYALLMFLKGGHLEGQIHQNHEICNFSGPSWSHSCEIHEFVMSFKFTIVGPHSLEAIQKSLSAFKARCKFDYKKLYGFKPRHGVYAITWGRAPGGEWIKNPYLFS